MMVVLAINNSVLYTPYMLVTVSFPSPLYPQDFPVQREYYAVMYTVLSELVLWDGPMSAI